MSLGAFRFRSSIGCLYENILDQPKIGRLPVGQDNGQNIELERRRFSYCSQISLYSHHHAGNLWSGLDPREMALPHSMQVYDITVVEVVI